MKYWWILIFLFGLAGCKTIFPTEKNRSGSESTLFESNAQGSFPKLADFGIAPELTNETWLNTDSPLRISDLKGKVVLLEMWTFGCKNCQNVIPYLKEWHARYKDDGLIVIGNHYPEFSYEKDLENLKDAINQYEIKYPVTQDNDGKTWQAYQNLYWPTLYLIDKQGHIRYKQIGEGNYVQTELAIKALLEEIID